MYIYIYIYIFMYISVWLACQPAAIIGARAYLFPQSVKNHYFCSGQISSDPICPFPMAAQKAQGEKCHRPGGPSKPTPQHAGPAVRA